MSAVEEQAKQRGIFSTENMFMYVHLAALHIT